MHLPQTEPNKVYVKVEGWFRGGIKWFLIWTIDGIRVTAETKTCLKDIYDHLYSSKVDLLKHSENIVGLKMV